MVHSYDMVTWYYLWLIWLISICMAYMYIYIYRITYDDSLYPWDYDDNMMYIYGFIYPLDYSYYDDIDGWPLWKKHDD